MNLSSWLWIILAALASAAGILYIKYLTTDQQWIYLLLILAFEFTLLFAYYQIFVSNPVGVSYTIIKVLAILLVLIGSYFFFKERYKVINIVGVAVIIIGIILLAL